MVRALAVSDEVVAGLRTDAARQLGVDLVLAAGDLPFDYLAELSDRIDRPGVLVPGNHDADLTGYTQRAGLWSRAGQPCHWPARRATRTRPAGSATSPGCASPAWAGACATGPAPTSGPRPGRPGGDASWSGRRAATTAATGAAWTCCSPNAPLRGCGDREDGPHHGFECLHDVVAALRLRLLVHGHIHPYGEHLADRFLGDTRVVNMVGRRILEA
ncbi:metallophosphoesterase [Pseudonocardia acidicola]|uniref:Metallophosphoesterase n=1 Tax=Pseudonocardia acidicola TaxID=2724939 RepID=A0ABX1SGH4_9PSEU|nr:metallophosphoesterase [Pseudonocardia acidicola]